jgi:D-alanine-D-alanine ligase
MYASALGIDKVRFKGFVQLFGYPTAPSAMLEKKSLVAAKKISQKLGFPFLFKVVEGGSSIGMEKVDNKKSIPNALRRMYGGVQAERRYFAEKFIKGKDLTAAILDLPSGTKLLSILEIKPNVDFYDESSKIKSQKGEHVAQYIVPARLSRRVWRMIEKMCLDIYKNAGCRGFARIDMVLDAKSVPYVLELNTIPGLQKESNFLLCADQAGLSPDTVLLALLYNALRKNPHAFKRAI